MELKLTKTLTPDDVLNIFRGTKYTYFSEIKNVVYSIFNPKAGQSHANKVRQLLDYVENYWSDSVMCRVIYSESGSESLLDLLGTMDRPKSIRDRIRVRLLEALLNSFYEETPVDCFWNSLKDLLDEIEAEGPIMEDDV